MTSYEVQEFFSFSTKNENYTVFGYEILCDLCMKTKT